MFWWLAGSEPDCQTSGSSPTIFKSYTAFDLGLKEEAQATQGVSWHFIHFDNGKTRVWPVHWSIFNIFQAASWRWLNVDECDSIYIYTRYIDISESWVIFESFKHFASSWLRTEERTRRKFASVQMKFDLSPGASNKTTPGVVLGWKVSTSPKDPKGFFWFLRLSMYGWMDGYTCFSSVYLVQ